MHPDLEQQALARRLRALPHAVAPPYGWHEFQRRAQRRPPERLARGRAPAAATVLVLAVVALATRLGGWSPQSAPPQPPAQPAAPTAAMERWLASLPSEPAVVRVGTRAAVMGLEDRIAQLDDLLTAERLEQAQSERLRALQRERGRLVGTLVQVRYAETLADESR